MGCGSSQSVQIAYTAPDTARSSTPASSPDSALIGTKFSTDTTATTVPLIQDTPTISVPPLQETDTSAATNKDTSQPKMEESSVEVSDSIGDQLYGRSVSKESANSVTLGPEIKRKHIKYAVSKEETNDVLEKLDQCFRRLQGTSDYESGESHKDLEYIRCTSRVPATVVRFSDADRRPIFVEKMVENNITDLYIKIWKQCFRPAFLEPDEMQWYYYALKNITITMWNCTDFHDRLCAQVQESGLHLTNLQYLDDPIFSKEPCSDNKTYLIKGLFGIMTNLIQRGGTVRQELRNHNAVKIIQNYQSSENTMLQCKVAIILAYLIDEDENEMINSDDKNIVFIIKILKNCLQHKDHASRIYGYKASEVIHALNLLSANENNKMRIVDNGALPYYVQLMQLDGSASEQEQELAAEGIWSLAFSCGEALQKEPGLVQGEPLFLVISTLF